MESGDTEYAGEGPYCRGRFSKREGFFCLSEFLSEGKQIYSPQPHALFRGGDKN